MSTDTTAENEIERSGTDTDLNESEVYFDFELEPSCENNILTTTKKSKIKIIKNSDCKSWTYHKGNLL